MKKNPFEYPSVGNDEKEPAVPSGAEKNKGPEDKKPMSAELTPGEKAEKERIYEEMKGALASLYGGLPHDRRLKTREVYPRLEGTPLEKVSLYNKDRLAEAIAWEGLNQKTKEEFIGRGLEILSLWIHTQALGRVATKQVEEINRGMRQHASMNREEEEGIETPPTEMPAEEKKKERLDEAA